MATKGNHSRRNSGGGATVVKFILLACVLLVMFAAGSTLFTNRNHGPATDSVPPVTSAVTPTPGEPDTAATPGADATTAPGTTAPEATTPAATTPPKNTTAPSGDTAAGIGASIAVPASAPVDDNYFADAVFIGNSRTLGLQMYGGVADTTFWTSVGLTVTDVFSKQIVQLNGQWLTVADALKQYSYSKVYIMLGMNELGWVYESVFKENYGRIIDVIKESHPDATIYVQSIIPVSKWKETNDSGNGTYTNANVIRLQKTLVELCQEKDVNYVNVAEVMQDTDGCLFSQATNDGAHLTAEYCKIWMEYLKTHTVK